MNVLLKINKWVYEQSAVKLVILYVVVMVGCVVLGIIAFFFPIMPICYLLDIEFSNLGPIATAAWAILFDVFVITPVFLYMGIVRTIHIYTMKHE